MAVYVVTGKSATRPVHHSLGRDLTDASFDLRPALEAVSSTLSVHVADEAGRCAACWTDGVWTPYPCTAYRWAERVRRSVDDAPEPVALPQRVPEVLPIPFAEAHTWHTYPTGVYRAVITGLREL